MHHIKQLYIKLFKIIFSGNIQRMEREDARTLRDCNWQTYSCCAGHPLMGMNIKIFPLCQWNRFSLVNPPPIHCYWSVFYGFSLGPWTSCDAGETVSVVARSNYREIIITGDNTGRMKVFKYPSSTNMVTWFSNIQFMHFLNLFFWTLSAIPSVFF